jgi:glycosyltransferase involved in cell wall biosynthesis
LRPEFSGALISIIAPLYNEEQNVRPLYANIVDAMRTQLYEFEIIFVDDGSTDTTAEVARELALSDRRLYLVQLRRNFGQTPAMSAGIDFAHGEILVTLDGDLQNDPRDIPKLIDAIQAGADLAVGWRQNRKDHSISRLLPSRIANWLIAQVTGIRIKDNGCSLKAYRAPLIKRIPLYSEMHRFIPAMASIAGARVEQIPVQHHKRRYGKSKYGIGRTWRVLFDLLSIKTIIAFSSRPLLWFSAMAFIPATLAIRYGYLALLHPIRSGGSYNIVQAGIASQFGALAAFLFVCGVIGELVFRAGDTREHRFAYLSARTIADYQAADAGLSSRSNAKSTGTASS